MQQEELLLTENDTGSIDEADDDEDEITDEVLNKNIAAEAMRGKRSMASTVSVSRRNETGRPRVFGSVMNGDREDSMDSDLELEGEDDGSDLNSDDELELMNLTSSGKNRNSKVNQ